MKHSVGNRKCILDEFYFHGMLQSTVFAFIAHQQIQKTWRVNGAGWMLKQPLCVTLVEYKYFTDHLTSRHIFFKLLAIL